MVPVLMEFQPWREHPSIDNQINKKKTAAPAVAFIKKSVGTERFLWSDEWKVSGK
jgi:hypothetical protein